jgi:hypothetical protein
MRKHFLLILLFFLTLICWSQDKKIGVINDPDGYTNLRAGKGVSFKIIDKILENEIFYNEDDSNENWLPVTITRCACDESDDYSNEIEGYVHRSRILELNKLEVAQMKARLNIIFNQELENSVQHSNFHETPSSENKIESNRSIVYHEMVFNNVLDVFSNYICEQKDTQVFGLFKKILIANSGSADELPSYALGQIFNCHPDWILYHLGRSHEYFYSLEWGFVNSDQASNKVLRDKLNNFRLTIGLEEVDYDNY